MIFDFIFVKCDTIKIAKCLREGRGEDGYCFGLYNHIFCAKLHFGRIKSQIFVKNAEIFSKN